MQTIKTDGDYEYRTRLYDQICDLLGENARSTALDQACRHLQDDVQNKRELMVWAEDNLTVEQLREVCAILSTSYVPMKYTGQWDVLNDDGK